MSNFKINSNNININAIFICRLLQSKGFQSFIVGGCVRDILLNTIPKDWDICTDASPEKVMELFPKHYPTGLAHGTITVAMGEGIENHFEVTTFRVEGEYLDGRRPETVAFVKDIKEDLARRDLTINAIAFDPISEQIVDPFGGINDLENKIIKAVGVADDRFREDGLRIMRVARFAARFGYEIEEKTFKAMNDNLPTLKQVSKERIKDELCKTLMTKHVFYGLNILKDTGIFHLACRSLMGDFDNTDFPPDVSKCSGELETKIALLYNKIQKDDALMDFEELKFSNKEIKKILFQLELLRRLKICLVSFDKNSYIELMAFIKNTTPDTWEHSLNQFITLTEALDIDFKSLLEQYQLTVVFARKELKINGNDLLGYGVKSGPDIKRILDECYSLILFKPELNNLDFLSEFVKQEIVGPL
jgi:tRNA nucleotidyltransferase (CCA-adding enzyme)